MDEKLTMNPKWAFLKKKANSLTEYIRKSIISKLREMEPSSLLCSACLELSSRCSLGLGSTGNSGKQAEVIIRKVCQRKSLLGEASSPTKG
ncbi:hypothetical protein DUI87_16408 [Hirundo rustica rustica]|uniref:Uncharacterized protein n=1 Tax=Hirundo rustica rustica TaxID=333673 RepID=A0A3M0K1E3_HIRRU|nr:hypothetical protein DUI87_16408 [Hirundo rustica rustica]